MPKIQYRKIQIHGKTRKLIEIVNSICNEYMADGYTLTLRQLYYQLVARDVIPNNYREYKNLGNTVTTGRIAGLIDWLAIEDRGRNLGYLTSWDSEKEFVNELHEWFRYDWWKNQDYRIEVWVEKDALASVVERTAFKYRCAYMACRGYMSSSEMWQAGQRFFEYNRQNQKVILLHLGDHDPRGMDMTRDNLERLELLTHGWAAYEVIRIALNKDQVQKYNPPPNPTKITDKLAGKYIKEHGQHSWELDALNPKVLDNLISEKIEEYIDWEKFEAIKQQEEKSKQNFRWLAYHHREK